MKSFFALFFFVMASSVFVDTAIAYNPIVASEHIMTLEGGMNQPSDISIHADGDVYLLDGLNDRVVVFDSSGGVRFSFTGEASGAGRLKLPMGIDVNGDTVYVTDTGNHRIVLFDRYGIFIKAINLSTGKPEKEKPEPTGIIVSDGTLFWSDRKNHKVCGIDIAVERMTGCFGGKGEGDGSFLYPFMLSADSGGYIHVVDVLNGRVQYFNSRKIYYGSVSRFGLLPGTLFRPNGIAIDEEDRVYVTDSFKGEVFIFKDGRLAGTLGDKKGNKIRFETPVGTALWKDRLYIVDMGKNRVEVFSLAESEIKVRENVRAGSVSERKCATCHVSWHPDYDPKLSKEDTPVPVVASPRICYSCHHGAVIDSRNVVGDKHQHPNIHQKREENKPHKKKKMKIPAKFPLIDDEEPYCGTCHIPHNKVVEDYRYGNGSSWMRGDNKNGEMCAACHKGYEVKDKETAHKNGIHPTGLFLSSRPKEKDKRFFTDNPELVKGLPKSLKEAGAVTGEGRRMVCGSCHSAHRGKRKSALLLKENANGEMCLSCHADKKGVIDSDHDLRITARDHRNRFGKLPHDSGPCGTCHTMHGGKNGIPFLFAGEWLGAIDAPLRDRLCLECHREKVVAKKKRLKEYKHPEKDMVLRTKGPLFLYNDRLEKDEFGQIRCVTCHEPHKWTAPSNDGNDSRSANSIPLKNNPPKNLEGDVLTSFLRHKGVKDTFCVDCHGLETNVKYKYFHDKLSRGRLPDYLKK